MLGKEKGESGLGGAHSQYDFLGGRALYVLRLTRAKVIRCASMFSSPPTPPPIPKPPIKPVPNLTHFPAPRPSGDDSNHEAVRYAAKSNGEHHPEAGVEHDELHVPCPPHTTERRLIAKIDLRVVPFAVVLYLMAFLDRINMGNARAFRLQEDLNLTGDMFNTALTIFFVVSLSGVHARACGRFLG
jgi:hypothetical protein